MVIYGDPVGQVSISDKVLRKINSEYVSTMKRAFNLCNDLQLFDEYIISTTIYHESKDELTFEHEKIPFMIYPYEWSSLFFRDGALGLLNLMEQLLPHGFIVSDMHPFNLAFHKEKMLFLDFSALIPGKYTKNFFRHFIRHYILPLYLFSNGQPSKVHLELNYKDIAGYLNPLEAIQYRKNYYLLKLHLRLGNVKQVLRVLKNWILSIDLKRKVPGWGDYYKGSCFEDHKDPTKWRFKQQVVDRFLDQVKPKTVLDTAGNGGLYSLHAAEKGAKVICFDIDCRAIDVCYQQVTDHHIHNLIPLVQDFTAPCTLHVEKSAAKQIFASLFERIGEIDMMLMLAVVHHLVFTQKLTFKEIFLQIRRFNPAFLCIEFPTPQYEFVKKNRKKDKRFHFYNETNFVHELSQDFHILDQIVLQGEEKYGTETGNSLFFLCERKQNGTHPAIANSIPKA